MPAVRGARLGALFASLVSPPGCGPEATFLTPTSMADEEQGTSRTPPRPAAASRASAAGSAYKASMLTDRRAAKQQDFGLQAAVGAVGAREIHIVLEMTSGNGRESAWPANAGQHRTALMSVFAAAALVVLKLGTGLLTGSLALVSAGIESSGDVVAAVLTLLAVRLSVRPADANHPYGHRRAENLAALGEAAILTGGGIVVVVEAIGRLTGGGEPFEAHWYVFAVIAIALGLDVSRVVVSVRGAARYKSAALRSNAFHFAGDMAGSVAVLAGLLAVRAGFHQGDAIAALIVAAIIFSAAGRLIFENARVLMDTTPAEAHARAYAAITDLGDDIDLRRLRVRESGGQYFADAVVAVPPGQAAVEGQEIAEEIESAVRSRFQTARWSCTLSLAARASACATAPCPPRSPNRSFATCTTSRSTATTGGSASRCT